MSSPEAKPSSWSQRMPLILAALAVGGGLAIVGISLLDDRSAEGEAERSNRRPGSQNPPPSPQSQRGPDQNQPAAETGDREIAELIVRAKTQIAANDLPAAAKSIDEALARRSEHWEAHMLRGVVAAKRGHHEEALQHFARAEQEAPREPELAQSKATSLLRLGRTEEAHALFSQVITWDPELAEAYLQRGLIEARRDEFGKAAEDFTRFIELRPESPAGYQNRAAAWARLGAENKARLDQMRARELQALQQERAP